jgi:purine-nucleoside phosphorylase
MAEPPEVAVVLGSGLAGLAEGVADAVAVPYGDVPGFPPARVAGHDGRWVIGRVEGRAVLLQSGRFHAYEGVAPDILAGPVRVAHALGARFLIVTNAAGGIRRDLDPGCLLLIEDHVNLMWRSPLAGAVKPSEERFPDLSAPYDRELQALALRVARDLALPLERGTYAAVLGPSYETPAEVEALRRLGAHAVGMSTVPEVLVARALGMRVLAFSLITNRASGRGRPALSHGDVLEAGRRGEGSLGRLIRQVIRGLPRAVS